MGEVGHKTAYRSIALACCDQHVGSLEDDKTADNRHVTTSMHVYCRCGRYLGAELARYNMCRGGSETSRMRLS